MIGKFLRKTPHIAKTSFIAPSARLIGAVRVGEYASVWFNTVARADINKIEIGAYTNIQDAAILHVEDDRGLYIGEYVTVGHGAILHACHIENCALIGMGAIILNGARIEKGSIVAAGAVVTEDFKAPGYRLIMGVPAKVVRKLTEDEKRENIYWARKYAKLSREYKKRK
ncbi:MAG: gamma carbonic anhydrase family protein [Candidatus Omnitrophota bacterium]|nr:gamma carbonic anhydrase family protein [Candidatus Omnitrophota bacterium]